MSNEAINPSQEKPGPNLLFIGPPGAGKGTLADKLGSLNVEHISSGHFFREEVARKTPLGTVIESSMAEGAFVSDETTLAVMKKWYFSRKSRKGFLLDGFPRNLLQAKVLAEWMATRRETLAGCIYLELSLDEAIARITQRRVCLRDGLTYHLRNLPPKVPGICDRCGEPLVQRADDTEETVRHRWELFEKNTLPLVDYYREQGLIHSFDASASVEELETQVLDAMRCIV